MDSIELKGAGQPAQANSSAMDFESSREEAIHRVPDVEKQRYKAESIDQQFMARYGKKQQLKRRFNSLSSIGLVSGVMKTWASVLFGMQFGLANGGPAGLIYGFLGAWCGATLQALVMAEMASMIPLAGGPFNWVAILAPPSCKKFLSYMAGWFTIINWQTLVVGCAYGTASQIQGLVALTHPTYTPQLWQATLMSYGISLFAVFVVTYLGRQFPRIEAMLLVFYIMTFFGVMITLAYLAPHRTASEVFTVFQNLGGWPTQSLSFFVGWITSVGSFLGADGSDHIAEEIRNAPRIIPLSIWVSTLLNGVLGLAMLITVVFCIGDMQADAETPTGFPFIAIFAEALGSIPAGAGLAAVLVTINGVGVPSSMATAARMLWAFSREGALPFSSFLIKVDPKTCLPINAILATLVINVLLALISVGSLIAYEALFSIVLSAYFSSFILAASVMLHRRLTTGPISSVSRSSSSEIPWGPFRLGRLGTPITILALAYSVVGLFFSFWPPSIRVTPASMNYASLVYGIAVLLSLGFWISHGRRRYTGPVWEF